MTRPDSRLLLPASAVARVPYGARVWSDDPKVSDGRPWVWSEWTHMFSGPCAIDLSAPTDGDRLDALPWALGVLAANLGCVAWRAAHVTVAAHMGPAYVEVRDLFGGTTARIAPRRIGRIPCVILDPWPDLSGLTPDEQARAVVVAALVALAGVVS